VIRPKAIGSNLAIAVALFATAPAQALTTTYPPVAPMAPLLRSINPCRRFRKAAWVMVAGDTAIIRAGTYRGTVTPMNSGTQSAPITYMPYNRESVTVRGADVISPSYWSLSSGSIYSAPIAWDLTPENTGLVRERELRQIAREPRWDLQRTRFDELLAARDRFPSIAVSSARFPKRASIALLFRKA
jgi:hypothetical protein